ncbi:Hypothetical protein NGAL_HAMBI2605_15080 [Neorhizobium galegae bv. orientalis]|nr:Hypothetical protein NGAL_HAMBI2605_15080 [Neorhizobium galegae bv. orientalis]
MDRVTFERISSAFGGARGVEVDLEFIREHNEAANWLNTGVPPDARGMRTAITEATGNVLKYLETYQKEGGSNDGDTPLLFPNIPAISRDAFKALIAWLHTQQFNTAALASVVAGYLYETRLIQVQVKSVKSGVGSTLLDSELASYAAWKNEVTSLAYIEGRLGAVEKAFDDGAKDILDPMRDRLEKITQAVIDGQKLQADAVAALGKTETSMRDAATAYAKNMKNQEAELRDFQEKAAAANAQLAALKEGLATISAKKLWDDRASSAGVSFWASSVVLGVLLLGVPLLAIYYLDFTLGILRHIGEATMQGLPAQPTGTQLAIAAISRLVVVTLPIALYLWVIRLVVRFNLRSLALLDDARQRHTMMDTYFHLIAEQAAVKEDRALILAALFRPSPGQGPDNVEPPNFTELLGKAMGK